MLTIQSLEDVSGPTAPAGADQNEAVLQPKRKRKNTFENKVVSESERESNKV